MTQSPPLPIHMGRGIQHARELRNWTQEGLAEKLGPEWNQKKVSNLEKKQTIDEDMLARVAGILGVDVADLRNFSPQGSMVINTFNDHSGSGAINGYNSPIDSTQIVNDVKEIVTVFQKQMEESMAMYREQTEEIKKLYERLLAAEGK